MKYMFIEYEKHIVVAIKVNSHIAYNRFIVGDVRSIYVYVIKWVFLKA